MRIDNDGVGLHVQVEGQGPPLVLLHGITTSAATYDWLTPRLAARFRTHALDFRGHGSSDRAPGAYEIRHFVSDAVALLDHLGNEPAVVIGHSLGGVVGACLGQQFPDSVRALFLEDPALHRPGSGPLSPDSGLRAAFAAMRAAVPQWQEQGLGVDDLRDPFGSLPASGGGGTLAEVFTEDALDALLTSLLTLDAAVLDPVLGGVRSDEYRPDRPIGVPGVVLAPDPDAPDGLLKPDHLDELRALNPGLRIEVVAGAGHMIHDSRVHRPTYLAHLDELLADLSS
jgi:pimeloyl-ACP methyl ester carboxylesterase